MGADNGVRETEFFVMRTAQLPNQQGIQVNCNVFKGESLKDAYGRLLRVEDFIDKVRKRHQIVFMEEQMRQLETRIGQELDVAEDLKKQRQSGAKMKDNALAMIANLPKQIEQGKQALLLMRQDHDRVTEELKDFV